MFFPNIDFEKILRQLKWTIAIIIILTAILTFILTYAFFKLNEKS
jgi:capsular polysaccharide biosynthesis protein